MDLLFQYEGGYTYPSVQSSDYSYRSWEVDDGWHEVLEVYGKPVLEQGEGFRPVLRSTTLVTLHDKECHIWKYLELHKRGSFASGMASVFMFFVTLICVVIFSQLLSYALGGYGILTWVWYVRYPVFAIFAVIFTVGSFFLYDKMKYELKLRKAARYIRKLSEVTHRPISYYKEVVRRMTECQNKERANTAKKLIERDLI